MKRSIAGLLLIALSLAITSWAEPPVELSGSGGSQAVGAVGTEAQGAAEAPNASSEGVPPAGAVPQPAALKAWLAQKRSRKSAFFGALLGAAAGALRARALGENVARGALAGGVVGGVVGFLVGRNQDKISASRDEAARMLHYDPSQGYVLKVEEMKLEPPRTEAGQTATLSLRYIVIGPDPLEDLTVNYSRGIKYQDAYISGDGPSSFIVPHGGGVVTTTSRLTIPGQARAGTYGIEALLEDPSGRFQTSGTNPLYIGE